MNDLSNLNGVAIADLAKELGAQIANENGNSNASRLPELKIESQVDDENGNALPRGQFYIKNLDKIAYAKDVLLRPLQHGFQYLHWDSSINKLACKSLIIPHFGEEARDTNGTIRCGKPISSVLREMAPEEKEKFTDITCFRQVRGLANFTGKTLAGESITYTNQPVIMMLKGTNFLPFEKEFLKVIPRGRNIWDFQATLSSKRHKNGSVTWYTFHFAPDLKNPLGMDQDTVDNITAIAEAIRAENKRIDTAYKTALAADRLDQQAINAIETSLDDDFGDAA